MPLEGLTSATVSDMPITEQGIRGLSQIAKEIADDLEGIHKEYVRQSDGQRSTGSSTDALEGENVASAATPEQD